MVHTNYIRNVLMDIGNMYLIVIETNLLSAYLNLQIHINLPLKAFVHF